MKKHLIISLGMVVYASVVFCDEITPRIVNGVPTQSDATVGALLHTFTNSNPPDYSVKCTGTLIGCRSFLTAAHCVSIPLPILNPPECNSFTTCSAENPANLRVYLQNGGIYEVAAIKINPSYVFGVGSDNAVLTLSKPISGIPPSQINKAGTPAYMTEGKITGFGVTDGFAADNGMKRTGLIKTDSCSDLGVPEPANICWRFDSPVGSPGSDSNICFGDSGGPLLLDMGNGEVVAGVTSGTSGNCEVGSISFDDNVYESRNFINASLATSVDERGLCRIDIRKRIKKYINSVYNAQKQCIDSANKGSMLLHDCLATKAAAKTAKAVAALSAEKLAKRCPAPVLVKSELGGMCGSASTPEDLKACIIDVGNEVVNRMLDIEYADNMPVLPFKEKLFSFDAKALLKCQNAVSGAAKSYLFKSLNTLNQCEARIDKGKIAACPTSATLKSIEKYAASLEKRISKACSDAAVAVLHETNPFGFGCGVSTNTADLIECERDEHERAVHELVSLVLGKPSAFGAESCGLISQIGDNNTQVVSHVRSDGTAIGLDSIQHTFSVPSGVSVMRVTLNGDQSFLSPTNFNDIDLYLSFNTTSNSSASNANSFNYGTFESIEIKNPKPGEWRAIVVEAGPAKGKDYQLTATMFKP